MNKVLVLIGAVLLVLEAQIKSCLAEDGKEDELTARDLLRTIAPTYHLAKLPPGFPPLHKMNTDKFDYNTGGRYIKVAANFNKPVPMVKGYLELSKVGMNFTYDKQQPKNGTWKFSGRGTLALGSEVLHVSVTEDGELYSSASSISLKDIVKAFDKDDKFDDTNIDPSSINLKQVSIKGKVWDRNDNKYFYLHIYGILTLKKVRPTNVALSVIKYSNENLKLYSVMEFTDNAPSRVLRQIMSPKTLDIPFFDNLLSESDLMRRKRRTMGVAFSLTDIFRFRYNSVSGGIIKDVLQSHIPTGVTLLCPINFKEHEDPINLAFVMKRPTFDFLVDKHDKITLKRVLKALSSEFSPPSLPPFLKQTNNAFTSHISYNSDTSMFSLFVRLKDHMGLAPNVLRSRISTVVLVRNASQPKAEWKMSVRGRLYIGGSTLRMQYSQLSNDDHEKVYGLTGVSKFLRMQDIIKEFKPKFYANKASKQMIQNTEIDDFTIKKVNLFSRITRTNTPHILLTGFTSLPAWEKQIRVAMLLLSFKDKWFLKMAVTFTHSPLSNILQALTGFDTRDISVLHNTHIMTSIITSTLRDHSFLPPKIITTPLLRLPIAKGITVIALLKFPDNCGDDKICQAAVSLLGKSKVYTLRGELSMDGFTLQSPHSDDIILGHGLEAVNNTLEFTIANDSRFDVISSLIIKRAKLSFDGKFHIYKTGQIQVQMQCRKTLWTAPFGLHALAFKDMSLTTFFKPGEDLKRLKLEGTLLMGALGNGGELKSPLYLEYNPSNPHASSFHSNISNVTLQDFMKAFTIDTPLPYALKSASFPNGLMVSYSSIDQSESSDFEIHGDVLILGRSLACDIKVIHPGTLSLITDNSPAPVILGGGQIIVQKDAKSKLRGPHIFAKINHSGANVTMSGYVKVLGIESEANILITDDGLSFEVTGKIMDYKEVTLKAESKGSLEDFTVSGCFEDIPEEVQYLLLEIIEKAGNQSSANMQKAEENLLLAQEYFDNADKQEMEIRTRKDIARKSYEGHLLEYGRFEVLVNDTCVMEKCHIVCFGCPEWNHCCRRDIFGECVSCPSWKKCCWRNIDPICIARHDGCHVVLNIAERMLSDRQAMMVQERIGYDSLEQLSIDAAMNKGKHKAVLEAAMDAKRLVIEDSSPGLNAAETVKNFGPASDWIRLDSVCFNTSIQEAATGCMFFHIKGEFSQGMESTVSIGSCLKDELVSELAESLANYIFPGIVDTSSDDVTDVKTESSVADSMNNGPQLNDVSDSLGPAKGSSKHNDKVEQDALYKRGRRDVDEGDGFLLMPVHVKARRDTLAVDKSYKRTLLNNPFWEFKLDHRNINPRSKIPVHPKHQQIMTGMIHKRWRIPDSPVGRCHIFHQLIDICKDMAETLLIMDKTLTSSVKRYKKEKRTVLDEVSSTDSFLSEALHRLQMNSSLLSEVDKTLQVVNQGVDIWATKCEKELTWQNNIGVENWLTAMDLRIQELGGFGVYRFLENLFHAFEALFEASTYSDDNAEEALLMLQRIRKVSTAFDKMFKDKLSITSCQSYAKEVLHHIDSLKHETMFCS